MNTESIDQYLKILRPLGRPIVKTHDCCWEEARRFGYVPVPSGLPVPVSARDIRYMFWKGGALALRVFSNRSTEGDLTFYHACKDHHYDLTSLRSEARRKVLRGLKNFQVKELDKKDLSPLFEQGIKINASALARQKRPGQRVFRDADMWRCLLEVYKGVSHIRIYGAFSENQLCAYLVIFQSDKLALYLHSFSSTEFLRYYPNNALLFYATKDIMKNPEIDEFYIGLESLASKNSLNEFTLSLGFQRYPIWQKLILHPFLKPLTSDLALTLMRASSQWFGSDYLVGANNFLQGLKSKPILDRSHSTGLEKNDEIER